MSKTAAPLMTVVSPEIEVSLEEMARRVVKTREQHGQMLQDYHKVWYESGHTWPYTHFLGIGLMKSPNDLWVYQALMNDHRPKTVIETGTYHGASALWFAFLMDMLGIDGKVFTIDCDDRRMCGHPRITFLDGDSTDPKLAEAVREQIEYPLLISLDADHSEAHVRKELDLYAPMCRVGDWLVVEDTNIAWLDGPHVVSFAPTSMSSVPYLQYRCTCGHTWQKPSTPEHICPNDKSDRGARGGLESYLLDYPGEFRQDVLCERYLLTMHPGGWLQRVAPCQ